jgi:plastocyanin
VTATAYILPDAQTLGPMAFGDEALVIYKGERLKWVNLDKVTHALVADTAGVPDFRKTDDLAPGGEQSFIMTRTGTTTFHCTIHPGMVGTLVVRER